MTSPLRPSTLGEILDRTAGVYRAHFLAFLGMAAPPAAVLLGCMGAIVLLSTTFSASQPKMAALLGLGMLGVLLVGVPLYAGAGALSSAAMSHAASSLVFEEPITIRGSWQAAWRHGWRYIGVYLLEGLLVTVAPIFVWVVLVAALAGMAAVTRQTGPAASPLPTAVLLLAGLVLAAYAGWMLLRLCMAFPVAVVEGARPWASLKRAATLSDGTRGRILVLYLLGTAIGWIVSVIFMAPLFVLPLIPGMNSPQQSQTVGTIAVIVFYGISFAVQALTKPIYGIAVVLFYYDQRVRKEGFDVELLMRQAGMESAQPEPAEVSPWTLPPMHSPGTGVQSEVLAASEFSRELAAMPADPQEQKEPA
jgi:hypothetical protein